MSKKLIIDWNEYNRSIDELAVQISESGFKPSFIICIARGGLRVGDILSRIFKGIKFLEDWIKQMKMI